MKRNKVIGVKLILWYTKFASSKSAAMGCKHI